MYGALPMVYRPREGRESIVPPPTPPSWEATPEAFDVLDRGRFFDWFLVRKPSRPDDVFAADPAIVLESHVGLWWLYRRRAVDDGGFARRSAERTPAGQHGGPGDEEPRAGVVR
jgi:hypothetical protein